MKDVQKMIQKLKKLFESDKKSMERMEKSIEFERKKFIGIVGVVVVVVVLVLVLMLVIVPFFIFSFLSFCVFFFSLELNQRKEERKSLLTKLENSEKEQQKYYEKIRFFSSFFLSSSFSPFLLFSLFLIPFFREESMKLYKMGIELEQKKVCLFKFIYNILTFKIDRETCKNICLSVL